MKNLKYKLTCVSCGNSFRSNQPKKGWCSNDCRKIIYSKRTGRFGSLKIPTPTVGSISELKVSIDLMGKGYSVFRALSPACFCDLIAIKDNEYMLLEVRTGYIGIINKEKVIFCKTIHTNGGIPNYFAVYSPSEDKIDYIKI